MPSEPTLLFERFLSYAEGNDLLARIRSDLYGEFAYWLNHLLDEDTRAVLLEPLRTAALETSEIRSLLDCVAQRVPQGLPFVFRQSELIVERLLGIPCADVFDPLIRERLHGGGIPFWGDLPAAIGVFPATVGSGTRGDVRGVRATIVPRAMDSPHAPHQQVLAIDFRAGADMEDAMAQARSACVALVQDEEWSDYLASSSVYVSVGSGDMPALRGRSIGLAASAAILAALSVACDVPNPRNRGLSPARLGPAILTLPAALAGCVLSAGVSAHGDLHGVGALSQKLAALGDTEIARAFFFLGDLPQVQQEWSAVNLADRVVEVRQDADSGRIRTQSGRTLLGARRLGDVIEVLAGESAAAQVVQPEPVSGLAGFWARTGAFLMDFLAVEFAILVIGFFLNMSMLFGATQAEEVAKFVETPSWMLVGRGVETLALALYFTIAVGRWGQTLGMKALGIRVVSAAHERPVGYETAFLRFIGYIVSFVTLGVGFLMVAWDPRRQGLHDKIAGTVVVRDTEAAASAAWTCQACASALPSGSIFCQGCGAAVAEYLCGGCRRAIVASARFCPYCGVDQTVIPGTTRPLFGRAGFWLRAGAYLIDAMLIALVVALPAGVIAAFAALALRLDAEETANAWDTAQSWLSLPIGVAYFSLSIGRWGQTLGKRVARVKVVGVDGGRVSYPRALLRWLGYQVSALLLGIGFLMIGWDRDKQGLHDKMARTCVIKLDSDFTGEARASLGVGIVGLLTSVVPGLGLLVSSLALGLGMRGLSSRKRGLAVWGIVLAVTGLVLTLIATVVIAVGALAALG